MIYRDNGDYDGAFQDFTEAIKVDSNDSRIYSFRGNVQLEKGNLDEAIDDFTHALLLAPDFANVYSYRAMAWEEKKNYLAAIADYKKYLDLKPDLEDDNREDVEKIIDELKKQVV